MSPLINYEVSTLIALFSLPLAMRAEWAYRSLPEISASLLDLPLPSLSVIIPARDEARNLSTLIPSLRASTYPGELEILVVDDHSTDETACVAAGLGASLVRLMGGLPSGWLGKPYACHQGALAASGEWLLFTDADTSYRPDALPQMLAYVLAQRLDGLSAFLHQDCSSTIDRLALGAAYTGLFAGLSASHHPLNGQLILIRRDAYLCSGGFEPVREQALEDLAFGRLLAAGGYDLRVARLESLGAVRMYRSRTQAFHGLSRLGSGSLTWMGFTGIFTAIYIAALVSPLVVLAGVLLKQAPWLWLVLSWGAASLSHLSWIPRFAPAERSRSPLGKKPGHRRACPVGAFRRSPRSDCCPVGAVFTAVWRRSELER